MPRVPHLAKIVATVAVALALTGGIAVGASFSSSVPGPEVQRAPAIVAANTTTQAGYVPLAPCRIVSTFSAGGRIAAGTSRTFFAGGTAGFPAQGGRNGGCGVPIGASAVAVSVSALHELNYGYLTLYAAGAARPNVNQVTYSKNVGTTTLVNLPVNPTTGKFTVFSVNPTDVNVDVAGYYREPIAATVAADGTILSQSGQIAAVTHESTGTYKIDFSENIGSCAVSATTQGSNYNAGVTVYSAMTIRVFVRALDQSTTSTVYGDTPFYVTVTC